MGEAPQRARERPTLTEDIDKERMLNSLILNLHEHFSYVLFYARETSYAREKCFARERRYFNV